jgi:hypothetical protein
MNSLVTLNAEARQAISDKLEAYWAALRIVADAYAWIEGLEEELCRLPLEPMAAHGSVFGAVVKQVGEHVAKTRRALKRAESIIETGLALHGYTKR